jgi:hypothetical protein
MVLNSPSYFVDAKIEEMSYEKKHYLEKGSHPSPGRNEHWPLNISTFHNRFSKVYPEQTTSCFGLLPSKQLP